MFRSVGLAVAMLALALVVAGGAESSVHPYGNRFPAGDFPAALAIKPDGTLLVAGSVSAGQVLVTRFEADGSLDSSFGSSGRVVTDADHGAVSVAVDAEDRILVLAPQHLFRFLADGTPDASFGDHGVVALASGQFAALALQPDGMIVVGGRTSTTPWSFLLERLQSDGAPDPAFGSDGVVTTAFQYFAELGGLALQPDGRVLAVGTDINVDTGGRNVLVLARYLSDGSLDPGFGTGGRVRTDLCGGYFVSPRVAVSSGGRIIAAATSLVRYLPDGSLDSSFAGGRPVPLGFDAGALILQPAGAAIVAGTAGFNGTISGAVVRVLPDGTVDRQFGVGGVRTPASSSWRLRSIRRVESTLPVAHPTPSIVTSHWRVSCPTAGPTSPSYPHKGARLTSCEPCPLQAAVCGRSFGRTRSRRPPSRPTTAGWRWSAPSTADSSSTSSASTQRPAAAARQPVSRRRAAGVHNAQLVA